MKTIETENIKTCKIKHTNTKKSFQIVQIVHAIKPEIKPSL